MMLAKFQNIKRGLPMKKAFSACFAFLFTAFLFASCTNTPGDPQGSAASAADAPSPSSAPTPASTEAEERENDIRFLQQAFPLGDGNENGHYRFQYREDASYNIKYIDYQTQQEIFLCSRPECTHDNEACSAWRPYCGSTGAVIPIGDELYLIYWGSRLPTDAELYGENALPHIEKAQLDGTNARDLVHFSLNENFTGGLAYDEKNIYVTISTTQKTPEDKTETFYRIASIDRNDGTVTYSDRWDVMSLCIEGAAGNHLLLSYYGAEEFSSLQELRKIYVLYDPAQKNATPLDPGSTEGTFCKAYNGNLLVVDRAACELKSISIATGETAPDIIHLDIPEANELTISYGCDDLLMIFNYPPDRPMTPYVFSLSEQKAYPILLPLQKDTTQGGEQKIDLLAKYGERYLVTTSVSLYNVTFPGSLTLPGFEYSFAFLSKEDLLQGRANYSMIEKMEG